MRWPWVSRKFHDNAMRTRRQHYAQMRDRAEAAEELTFKLQSQVNAADAKLKKIGIVVEDAKRQVTLHGSDPVVRLDDIEPHLL